MKKIFITIPWFVPAFRAGGPVKSVANLVNEFTEGVEYYIYCGDTDLNGAELENIRTNEWVSYNEWTSVWYARFHVRHRCFSKWITEKIPGFTLFQVTRKPAYCDFFVYERLG